MKVSKDAILVILLCTICYKWGELDVMDRVRMLYRLLLLSYDSYRVYMHTTLSPSSARPQRSVVVVIVDSLPVFQTPTRKPVSQQFAHLTRAILSTVRDTCQSILNNNNNSYVSYKQGNVMSSWRPQGVVKDCMLLHGSSPLSGITVHAMQKFIDARKCPNLLSRPSLCL